VRGGNPSLLAAGTQAADGNWAATDIDVWTISTLAPRATVTWLCRILSDDEHEVARRFCWESDRIRYIVTRGTLRVILGTYLHRPPRSLRFEYGSGGKPAVQSSVPLHFNVSHSHHRALVAVCGHSELGVDLERERPLPELATIISGVCSVCERASLATLAAENRLAVFYRCWTRKEAVLKAAGTGLSRAPRDIDVWLADQCPSQPVLVRSPQDLKLWRLHDLQVKGCCGDAYCGSLAAHPSITRIRPRSLVRSDDRGADEMPFRETLRTAGTDRGSLA
jgi:4'-phosphopantetheinyl transferase